MSEFDARAREWDSDKMHMDRSLAIASELKKIISVDHKISALEYGAGTGILSFLLRDRFSEIVLMDSSREMIQVCKEKKEFFKADHIKPLWFDLEQNDYDGSFDMIFNQMVLHHVGNIELILKKFYSLLKPGGILIIADLYSEDGSFHGPEVKVHLGFNPEILVDTLSKFGFTRAKYNHCFTVKRPTGKEYPVFFLKAEK